MYGFGSCPFCGTRRVIIDTLFNYRKGLPLRFRAQCQDCGAATRWCETEEEAWTAWNLRTNTPSIAPKKTSFINKDLFLYKGEMYARNPYTEQCFKDEAGKMKRIKKNDFLLAYADCQKQLGALK
jgi:Lar family restriction alleviation protein